MASLRERKKRKVREQIIKAAENSFLTQGYEKTTIAGIAGQANIGIGTFYNYFSSKSELFMYTFLSQYPTLEDRVNLILDSPGDNVADALLRIIDLYFQGMERVDKKLWKEIIAVFFSNIEESQKTMKEFTDMDFLFLKQVNRLFQIFQAKGVLAPDFDTKDGAECIYAIATVQGLFYSLDDTDVPTLEKMKDKIRRQVKLFFADKFNS